MKSGKEEYIMNYISELYQQTPNIVSVVTQRLRWLRHTGKMNIDSIPRLLPRHQIEGRKKRGRLKGRWISEAEDDLTCLVMRRWEEKPQGKNEWRRILNKVWTFKA